MRFIKKIPSRLITRLGIYQEPRRVSTLFAHCSSRVRSYRDDGGKEREWRREYKSVQRRETDINLRFRTKTLVGQSVCTESVRQTQWPNANSDQRPFRVFLRPPPSSSYPPLLTLSLLASPSGSTFRHFLASLDLSSISPPRPVFIVSPFLPARYTGLTEIEGKQDGRFEKAAFIQPVISSAMRLARPFLPFFSFELDSRFFESRRERERSCPTLVYQSHACIPLFASITPAPSRVGG